jgi:hypothetical protein
VGPFQGFADIALRKKRRQEQRTDKDAEGRRADRDTGGSNYGEAGQDVQAGEKFERQMPGKAMIRSRAVTGMIWAIVAVMLHVWPEMVAPAHGQGSRKDEVVFDSRGVPVAGATVRVCAMLAAGQP